MTRRIVRANNRARTTALIAFVCGNIIANGFSPHPSRVWIVKARIKYEKGRCVSVVLRTSGEVYDGAKSSGINVCVRTDNNSSRNDIIYDSHRPWPFSIYCRRNFISFMNVVFTRANLFLPPPPENTRPAKKDRRNVFYPATMAQFARTFAVPQSVVNRHFIGNESDSPISCRFLSLTPSCFFNPTSRKFPREKRYRTRSSM